MQDFRKNRTSFRLKEKEWFAERQPEIANARTGAARKQMIEALTKANPRLLSDFYDAVRWHDGIAHLIASSGLLPLCGRGRINHYAVFAETMRQHLSGSGMMGAVLPTGIATDDTTKLFFQELVGTESLVSLYDFENKHALFPAVDSNMKFCLFVCRRTSPPTVQEAAFVFFGQDVEDIRNQEKRFTLTAEDIILLNPNTLTCPVFRSKRDAEISKAIYRRVPVAIREGPPEVNPWGIRFRQGLFNMTIDSALFKTETEMRDSGCQCAGNTFRRGKEVFLPLYESKMIHHFDHRFASAGEPKAGAFIRGSSEYFSLEEHANPQRFAFPRSWVAQSEVDAGVEAVGWKRKWFLGFRLVTGNVANIRTAVFAILPYAGVGNSLPLVFPLAAESAAFALAANVSSFVFDYAARQKVGGINLNFYLVNQLPVLPPATYAEPCAWAGGAGETLRDWLLPRVLELTYTAWDLEPFARDCGWFGPPFVWDEARRFQLRCELDAAFLHLYGLSREDAAYILDTFPAHSDEFGH